MRQQEILDVAAEKPDASIDELAEAVHSATPALVERVLNEYGDPAPSTDDTATPDGDTSAADTVSPDDTETDGGSQTGSAGTQSEMGVAAPDTIGNDEESATETAESPGDTNQGETEASLSVSEDEAPGTDAGAGLQSDAATLKQLTATEAETLRAIQENPDATQRALAEKLGVSAATVSQRVNGIEGFEWSERASFVATVFDTDAETATMTTEDTGDGTADVSVAETLTEIERQLETLTEHQQSQGPFEDPELVSKIVHACMDAEVISEEEELAIIRALLS